MCLFNCQEARACYSKDMSSSVKMKKERFNSSVVFKFLKNICNQKFNYVLVFFLLQKLNSAVLYVSYVTIRFPDI